MTGKLTKKLSEGVIEGDADSRNVVKTARVTNPAGLFCGICQKEFAVNEIIYFKRVVAGKELGFEYYHTTCMSGRAK